MGGVRRGWIFVVVDVVVVEEVVVEVDVDVEEEVEGGVVVEFKVLKIKSSATEGRLKSPVGAWWDQAGERGWKSWALKAAIMLWVRRSSSSLVSSGSSWGSFGGDEDEEEEEVDVVDVVDDVDDDDADDVDNVEEEEEEDCCFWWWI